MFVEKYTVVDGTYVTCDGDKLLGVDPPKLVNGLYV